VANNVYIQIHSDWSGIDAELDRLDRMPSEEMSGLLNAVLTSAFFATQAQVHVITGSLKGSGNASSEDSHSGGVEEGQWTGTIQYGGPSPGFIHDPVNYAAYEQARHGSHDFMAPFYAFQDAFIEAMRVGLHGEHL
jgi:hypothetical protein